MAAPKLDRPLEEEAQERPAPTFKVSTPPPEEPGPVEPPEEPDGGRRPTGPITVAALVLALALGITTAFLGMAEAQVDFTIGETVLLVVVGSVVAALGLLPARWGWWVMPAVVLANYGLHLYNLTLGGGSWFQSLERQGLGAAAVGAVLIPLLGVVAGAVIQFIYRFAAGE